MRIGGWLLLAVFSAGIANAADDYTIKPGDLLGVAVWGEENLTQELRVLPDGSISFPLVGRVDVTGMGVADVEERLESTLDEYIPAADVSVSVLQADGHRIFVVGEVQSSGVFAMSTPLTVVQAIALAGGLTTFADDGGIRVLRGADENQTTLEVKYSRIMQGKNLETNYALEAGDTVLVP